MPKMETAKTKYKKKRSLQISYPSPYSQSWNPDIAPVLMKNSIGRATSLFQGSKHSTGPRPWSHTYSTAGRPDPSAPHLKYGVFRSRRGPLLPSTITPFKAMPPKPGRKPQSQPVIKIPQEPVHKQSTVHTKKNVQKKSKPSPVFVYHSIDRNFTKDLSFSDTMHVDIKPRRIASLSPSYCPSPNFKSLSKRIPATPTKLLYTKNEAY